MFSSIIGSVRYTFSLHPVLGWMRIKSKSKSTNFARSCSLKLALSFKTPKH